ncbi:GP88 family protein [Catelliglobosispora koreensis]|uniref:GP88 family protein n=1 Tax=Catelliglobosispora koreensis TaxID=129052 RepID=UPI000364763B|nr:hypothetical protein [Catelliglobosispora koreensis]
MNAFSPSPRPKRLLSNSNRNLARDRIWSWTIPALAARLPSGATLRTCPAAGVCAQACYARAGTYRFANVRAAHLRNLLYVLEDPQGWEQAMLAELAAPRFVGGYVRIHDAGDFFSDSYTLAWLRIIRARPHTWFYAYTKEVDRHDRLIASDPPPNSRWVMSLGGRQDHLVDPRRHRIADVFPTEQAIAAAGFHTQADSDLLAPFGPTPVGMAANNIAQFQRRQGDRTFGQWQRETDRR